MSTVSGTGAKKERLDVLVTERGLALSREKARALIMEGKIFVGGVREDKPGAKLPSDAEIELRGKTLRYVGRGGLKLEKALDVFDIALDGRVCMDVGASTGGFTDCMLQNGAARVYAIDSGRGQLAWSLRTDERVICMERTNFRYVTREQVPEEIGFAAADVSFISLTKLLPVMRMLLSADGEAVCLIKPQFEAGRAEVGKRGVVRDPVIHRRVIAEIAAAACGEGFAVRGLDYSPIRGPEGNIEYLLWLEADHRVESGEADHGAERRGVGHGAESGGADGGGAYPGLPEDNIYKVVEAAHREL